MRIAIFGGTGFVGSYLIDELIGYGHEPVVLVRPGSERKLRKPEQCKAVGGSIDDAEAIRQALEGADAAIYNIGILRAFPQQGITFEALQYEGARRVIDCAQALGLRRFLIMSANGVRADGTAYQRTKYMAEQYLQATELNWTIFRPSVIFGDPRGEMEFATQLYREIVSLPLPAPLFYDGLLPFGAGSAEMSPIHVGDVSRIVVASLATDASIGQVFLLGGPDKLSWQDILKTIAAATEKRHFALPTPAWAVKAVASLLERFPEFPITRDQITMLMEGNTCNGQVAFDLFDVFPTPFTSQTLDYLRTPADCSSNP